MPNLKLRSQRQVIQRCSVLRDEVSAGLKAANPSATDAIWSGEALGTLLWALGLVELPAYDSPFAAGTVVAVDGSSGRLRAMPEIELELEAARLWHWRARTTVLQASGNVELPESYSTFEQLVGATAMRGYEEGLLPSPLRGDFRAYGKAYRQLLETEHAEALSIAYERHRALAWLAGEGRSWEDVVVDT